MGIPWIPPLSVDVISDSGKKGVSRGSENGPFRRGGLLLRGPNISQIGRFWGLGSKYTFRGHFLAS